MNSFLLSAVCELLPPLFNTRHTNMDFIFYILSSVYPYGAELENLLTIKTILFNSVSFHELDAGNS